MEQVLSGIPGWGPVVPSTRTISLSPEHCSTWTFFCLWLTCTLALSEYEWPNFSHAQLSSCQHLLLLTFRYVDIQIFNRHYALHRPILEFGFSPCISPCPILLHVYWLEVTLTNQNTVISNTFSNQIIWLQLSVWRYIPWGAALCSMFIPRDNPLDSWV